MVKVVVVVLLLLTEMVQAISHATAEGEANAQTGWSTFPLLPFAS